MANEILMQLSITKNTKKGQYEASVTAKNDGKVMKSWLISTIAVNVTNSNMNIFERWKSLMVEYVKNATDDTAKKVGLCAGPMVNVADLN